MKAILILVLMLCGSMSNAGTMTKREFQKDGVAYIEEIIIGENGNISKSIYPKRRLVVVETETPMRVQTMPDLKPLPAKTQKKSSNKPAKTLYRSIAACKRFH